jgi:hypothetical protein
MDSNTTHNKILKFAVQEISRSEFERMLKTQTNSGNKMKIGWITELGLNRYYEMFWDGSAYVGGNAGGSDTKSLVDMYNVPVIGESGDWRTVDFNTVYKIRFNNKSYKVIN